MGQRSYEGEEAQRWKRKFLDALEDSEQREKSLTNRIRLLRRGLLGISLAGDGHDPQLDKQLEQLRKILRKDDRETGLELLLEHIEKSIIRLDNEKSSSNIALKEAFASSLTELDQLPLPGSIRRQLKKFSRSLNTRLEDPQQHQGLIRQFVDLLREAIAAMVEREQQRGLQDSQDGAQGGFWQRIFSTRGTEESSPETAAAAPPGDLNAELQGELLSARQGTGADKDPERQPPATGEHQTATDDGAEAAPDIEASASDRATEDLAEFESVDEAEIQVAQETVSLEGEVLRDRSGLQEPAFSYIAGHVEPILLRILESIHISSESFALADAIRRNVLKGLNWYDFVAVLEEILKILRQAADEQRVEFQGFLTDVTESLAQVQAFVENSEQYSAKSSVIDQAMDQAFREQVAEITSVIENENLDLTMVRQTVQTQIQGIISSMDSFKSQRSEQSGQLTVEIQQLAKRMAALEEESRELRLHLARQQQAATTDTLTELPNRDAYNQRIRIMLDHWRNGAANQRRDDDRAFCLAVADVDHFKRINDNYGHLAGDKVLKIVAREMAARLRDNDFVARYGGEEFVIILRDTRPADAEYVLNKIREAIQAIPFHFKDEKVEITLSFGVVVAERDDSPESVFERADQALYKAKQDGRNRVHRVR
jgi:diguanylate cyclase